LHAESTYLELGPAAGGPIEDLLGHSITYRVAVGPRAGQQVYSLQTVPARPRARARLVLVEAKASMTVTPAMAQSVGRLAVAITGYRSSSFVVHGGAERHVAGRALSPGVEAVTSRELLAELA
jgi:hypothetical protein